MASYMGWDLSDLTNFITGAGAATSSIIDSAKSGTASQPVIYQTAPITDPNKKTSNNTTYMIIGGAALALVLVIVLMKK